MCIGREKLKSVMWDNMILNNMLNIVSVVRIVLRNSGNYIQSKKVMLNELTGRRIKQLQHEHQSCWQPSCMEKQPRKVT